MDQNWMSYQRIFEKTNFAIFLLILIFENFEKSIFWVILPKIPQNGIQNAIFNSIMIV